MAKKTGIEVQGLKQTIRTLERFGVQVADLKAAFKRIGAIVATEAQSLAPKRSGRLAGTIKPSNTKNKSVVRAGGKLPYAGVIHYGWPGHGISPNPFLTKALSNSRPESYAAFERELQGLIRKLDLND